MATIKNPILTGFNPDPTICRAGEDYYIAVSTFEWFPGVGIYHSKDLEALAPCSKAPQPVEPVEHDRKSGLGRDLGAADCRTTTDSFGSSTRM